MVKSTKYSIPYQIFTVLTGALLMGFMWRVRGTHGWGSSWGLLAAGFMFTMFITMVKGQREKLNLGKLAVIGFAFMLTTPAWGTLLGQITGVIFKAEDLVDLVSLNSAYANDVYCSVPSALYIMLSLGFGLASLFGIFLGHSFSGKAWKIKDYIILIAVFFAVDLIGKATLPHLILDLIQPQAVEVFEAGCKAQGIEGTAWQVYMQHFDNVSWAKKIVGGRNYFQSVEMITYAMKSVAVLLTTRFIIKDKRAATTGFIVCGAFAFSITVSDLFFYFGNGGYHMLAENYFGDNVAPWSCWEYFTGFIAGGIITAYMLGIKDEEDVTDLAFEKVPKKAADILIFLLGYIFLIGVNIVRPVLERYDESKLQILYVVISVLVAVALVAVLVKKWGFAAEKTSMVKVSSALLPLFMALIFISYMFLCSESYRNYTSITMVHNLLVVVSLIAVTAWCGVHTKKYIAK